MIRYPITKAQLEALIDSANPTWRARAAAKTEEFRQKVRYQEASSIWSEVKPVYMRLQGNGKCAYCEREMESVALGRVEQDVEHFRPKGSVKAWKAPKKLRDAGLVFTAAPKGGKGYHLLAYHVFNYAAACKPCNSTLKKDYFPIAGIYDLEAKDPAATSAEEAYLLYPIGDLDEDPESMIEFHGTSPRPIATSGAARDRALVTIEFFKFDDPGQRKNLYRDRAILIMALFLLLKQTVEGPAAKKAKARKTLDGFMKPELRHLNCARSFRRLFERDPVEAEAVSKAAVEFITSIS